MATFAGDGSTGTALWFAEAQCGVASVLLSTTLYAGVSAQADTLNQPTNAATAAVTQASGSDSSTAGPGSTQLYSNSNYQSNAVKQPAAAATMAVSTSSRVPSSENTPKSFGCTAAVQRKQTG